MSILRWVRRRWRLLTAVLVVLTLAAGGLAWWFSRFPADKETLAGPPFELEVQSGVPASDLEQIRAGLGAMDAYLRSDVGVGVTAPVRVRVSWSQGCRLFLGPGSGPTAWVDGPDFICLNAKQDRWRGGVRGHAYYPAYVAAHEHVHNLQAQLGCYRDEKDHEWQWLFEGMASELAYRALLKAGLMTAADVELAIWEYRGLQDDNGTLADYERSSKAAGDSYGLFHLGARAAARGAGSPKSFADFCRAAASGTPWKAAFQTAFGIPVEDFYVLVEAERAELRATTDLTTGKPRSK